ncbi:MAG: hypothetical protein AB9919_03265 [Geobacteraceae bacterium]
MVVIRGNVQTRLPNWKMRGWMRYPCGSRLEAARFCRRVTEYLPVELSLPAISQGALGIECRLDDQELVKLISFLE